MNECKSERDFARACVAVSVVTARLVVQTESVVESVGMQSLGRCQESPQASMVLAGEQLEIRREILFDVRKQRRIRTRPVSIPVQTASRGRTAYLTRCLHSEQLGEPVG